MVSPNRGERGEDGGASRKGLRETKSVLLVTAPPGEGDSVVASGGRPSCMGMTAERGARKVDGACKIDCTSAYARNWSSSIGISSGVGGGVVDDEAEE